MADQYGDTQQNVFDTLAKWNVPSGLRQRFGWDAKQGALTLDNKVIDMPKWYDVQGGQPYASEDAIRQNVGRALGMEGFRSTAVNSGIPDSAVGYNFSSNQPTVYGKEANLGENGTDYVNFGGRIYSKPNKTQTALGPRMSPYQQGYIDRLSKINDPNAMMATPEYQAAKSAMERQLQGQQASLGRELASAGVLGTGSTPATEKMGALYYNANQQLNEYLPKVMDQYRTNYNTLMDNNLRAEDQSWRQKMDTANQTGQWEGTPNYNQRYSDQQQGNWVRTFDQNGEHWTKDYNRQIANDKFDQYYKSQDLAIRSLNASAKKNSTDPMEQYVDEQTKMYSITPKVARLQYTLEHWIDTMADKSSQEDAAYQDLLRQKPNPKDRAAYSAWQSDVHDAQTRTGVATTNLIRSKVDQLVNSNVIDSIDRDYLFVYMLVKANQQELPPELQAKFKVKTPAEALTKIRSSLPKPPPKDTTTQGGTDLLNDVPATETTNAGG